MPSLKSLIIWLQAISLPDDWVAPSVCHNTTNKVAMVIVIDNDFLSILYSLV
ncbi:unknown protein [Microcystis aeruginosa NIES-843]|uniref:Uncharacterized protein n=1 Tax=Microcystis aeruginosa (strain NIES-843 / IAM M-2473) TaxID=449447 RepID=B0JJS0_MICAN|nr:unknown protein [Microcystis aeruginosa NIES-843]